MGLEEATEVEEVEEVVEDQLEQTEEQEEVQSNPEEDKARKGGWTNKDEWKESGHDPDDWKSAKNFNEFGDVLSSLKTVQKDFNESKTSFDERLNNQRTFMEAQAKQKLEELQVQRAAHVENADTEGFNAVQKQIDNLAEVNKPAPQPAENPEQSTLNKWNATNPWINDSSPKASFAKSEFVRLNNSGFSVNESIEKMEHSVNASFPDVNERRQMANRGEIPKRSNTAKHKTLSMSDVTSEEKKLQHFFGDEKSFLQAVKDSRTKS